MKNLTNLFVTCPKNLEGLLEQELITLGAQNTKQTVAGVKFTGEMATAYRICLWSRLANRVLLPITEFPVDSAQDLYAGLQKINWLEHLKPTASLLIDFNGEAPGINNSHFGAQKAKDAIVDQIREKTGERPSVVKWEPDLRVNIHLHKGQAVVSIDLSGESLHKRAYRQAAGQAPIKENLAAALLYRANWLQFAKENKPFIDLFCGAGTLIIEAALMAADIAPGIFRSHFGFQTWLHFDKTIWQDLWQEAQTRREIGIQKLPKFFGFDYSEQALEQTKQHLELIGLEKFVTLLRAEISQIKNPSSELPGLIVSNPPYGERLGDPETLTRMYRRFGTTLRNEFVNWHAAFILGNPDLGKNMGIRSNKQYQFFNGAIPCKLLLFEISERWFVINK